MARRPSRPASRSCGTPWRASQSRACARSCRARVPGAAAGAGRTRPSPLRRHRSAAGCVRRRAARPRAELCCDLDWRGDRFVPYVPWRVGRRPAWTGGTSQTARAMPWMARSRPSASAAVRFWAFDSKLGTKACSPIGLGGNVSSVCIVAAAWSVRSFHWRCGPSCGSPPAERGPWAEGGRGLSRRRRAPARWPAGKRRSSTGSRSGCLSRQRLSDRTTCGSEGCRVDGRSVLGSPGPACRAAAGPGERSVLQSERGITSLGASAAWPCPGRRDP